MPGSKNTHLPTSRMGRFSRFTRLAGRMAGGMAAEGVRQLAAGKRPQLQQLILTPGNAQRLTSELRKLRGAAMKLGQILSMDASSLLPAELVDILAHLRSDAHYMPQKQLIAQLSQAYGPEWRSRFTNFEMRPVAAASIGQVHRVKTREGEWLALKIQYPGIRNSIDSDVENLASLLRLTRLIPAQFDLAPLLEQVKLQLRDEADYLLEADYLKAFAELLTKDQRFLVPQLWPQHSTESILAMDFVVSLPIESIGEKSQEVRNAQMEALIDLMLRELFELNLMQTDANFANYRYCNESGKIVLLDFGATRNFSPQFADAYRELLLAMFSDNSQRILDAAVNVGYPYHQASPGYQKLLVEIFRGIGDIFNSEEPYDFKHSNLWERIGNGNDEMMKHRGEWKAPPIDALYFHRKLGGLFMLAAKLDARVAVRPLIDNYL